MILTYSTKIKSDTYNLRAKYFNQLNRVKNYYFFSYRVKSRPCKKEDSVKTESGVHIFLESLNQVGSVKVFKAKAIAFSKLNDWVFVINIM